MFTLEQVNSVHDQLGSAYTLGAYLRALKAIGVEESVSFISDGHTEYYGKDGYMVASPPAHPTFVVNEVSDQEKFLKSLENKDYEEMSKGLADSGVEKWVFDTNEMTITYYDKADVELLVEPIV